MTEYSVYIIIPGDAPPEAKKELEKLEYQAYAENGIKHLIGIPFMLRKGLKYIPTILAWAFEEGGSYGGDSMGRVLKKHLKLMEEVYKELASKVDVKIEIGPLGGGEPSGLPKH